MWSSERIWRYFGAICVPGCTGSKPSVELAKESQERQAAIWRAKLLKAHLRACGWCQGQRPAGNCGFRPKSWVFTNFGIIKRHLPLRKKHYCTQSLLTKNSYFDHFCNNMRRLNSCGFYDVEGSVVSRKDEWLQWWMALNPAFSGHSKRDSTLRPICNALSNGWGNILNPAHIHKLK